MSNRTYGQKWLEAYNRLSKPDLRFVSAALRYPVLRPAGMPDWDYTREDACALRLVALIYGRAAWGWNEHRNFQSLFALSNEQHNFIFHDVNLSLGIPKSAVMATHVADAIDLVLAARSGG